MDWSAMFFQDWSGIVRTLLVGALAYITLVLFLRISGKRTLSKLNAFDLVVTVALGSTLSAIVLQESVALAEGAAALALLIFLQFAVTYWSVRSKAFAKVLRSEPTLLAHAGAFCSSAMHRERITEEEALAAIRASGGRDVTEIENLVLESDGSISASLRARPEIGAASSTAGTASSLSRNEQGDSDRRIVLGKLPDECS